MLLRADAALATIDAAFRLAFDTPAGHGLNLWGTYSEVSDLRWGYLLSVCTPKAVTLQLADLGSTAGHSYVLLDVWAAGSDESESNGTPTAGSLQLIPAGGSFTVLQSPLPVNPGHSDSGTYQILAPVMKNGWCLLGEARKTVAASRRRFATVAPIAAGGFSAALRAATAESVAVWVLPPSNATAGSAGGGVSGVVEVSCPAGSCTGLDCDVQLLLECTTAKGCTCKHAAQ